MLLPMPHLARLFPIAIFAASVASAQNLPAPAPKPLEFEPQLILTDPNAPPAGGVTSDVTKIENGLQRAKRDAVEAEALWKKGIFAKVEAERAAMKVVVLTKKLSDARLQIARDALDKLADGSKEAKAAAELAVKDAEAIAQTDGEALHKAQVDAAALNLWRTQQLQNWGAATKLQVARAKEQLAAVQGGAEPAPPTPAPAATPVTFKQSTPAKKH